MRLEESSQYARWLSKLGNDLAKCRIEVWMYRMQRSEQLLGDRKHLGADLIEFRFFVGAGYRVYASLQRDRLLILLAGGDKSSQAFDIRKARRILHEWRRAHES